MRTKNELYQEALRTVAARRQMARARAEDARAEAEAAVPALRHAEDEVRVRGLRCALAGASGKDRTEAAAALADARQKLTALLAASGRPADALEPKFSCKLCQDTGTVNGTDAKAAPDGTITSTVDSDSFPTEDGQSNFGTGYAYRYGSENGTLEVQIDGEWWIFAANQ